MARKKVGNLGKSNQPESIGDLYIKASSYVYFVETCRSLYPKIDLKNRILRSTRSKWKNLHSAVNGLMIDHELDIDDIDRSSIKYLHKDEHKIETVAHLVQILSDRQAKARNIRPFPNFHGRKGLAVIKFYRPALNQTIRERLEYGSDAFLKRVFELVKAEYTHIPADISPYQLSAFHEYWGPIVSDVLRETANKTGPTSLFLEGEGDK